MSADPQSHPASERDRLEAATDQAIVACGGDACDAVKALIVANEFLESELCELTQAVSHAYLSFTQAGADLFTENPKGTLGRL
jgi:hypothetical protein